MAKLSDVYGITKPAPERKALVIAKLRTLKATAPKPPHSPTANLAYYPVTFSADAALMKRVEDAMHARRILSRSETIRVLLGEALAK